MFKLPIPTRLTDYLGEAVVWTVIIAATSNPISVNVPITLVHILCKTLDPILLTSTIAITSRYSLASY